MTTGLTRREGAQDSLAGQANMEPVQLQGPGLANPTPMGTQSRTVSTAQRLTQELAQWGQGKLAAAVEKQQQRDILDGQMAHMQGQTMEQVQMGGRPWALEGYRMMDAQTMASTMLAAQREEIAQAGYEMSPDDFRAHMGNRIEGMLEGVDPRTAELVRAQMVDQLPVLVADHTQQHLAWQEQEAYDSLERSVDIVSRDPTSVEQLIAFAEGGEDSPSAGLSDDRRTAAVVSGIVRAFDNDNPLAYSAIMGSGVLGDSLTSDQINTIRSAQSRFEQRRRSEYDEALFNGEQALMRRLESGDLTPSQAVEELSSLYADHDINMTAAEAGAIYSDALGVQRTENRTASLLIEEATLRGDFDTVARLSARVLPGVGGGNVGNVDISGWSPAVVSAIDEAASRYGIPADHLYVLAHIESGGDPTAQNPHSSAGGLFQFLDGTARDYGLTNKYDPQANADAGARFYRDNREGLRATLGREPTVGEMYLAHQQGLGGARQLLANPHVRAASIVGADAVLLNGGTVDMTASEFARIWTSRADGLLAARNSGARPHDAEEWSNNIQTYQGNVVHAALAHRFGHERTNQYIAGRMDDPELVEYEEQVQSQLDNWRAPTAADRLELARNRLTETRDRLAMETYERMQPELAGLDDRYLRGEIERGEWMQGRQSLFHEYEVERTRGDVDREIAISRQVDADVAAQQEEAADTEYQLALERAQAEITSHRLDWEEVINDPASTLEQRRAANEQYAQAQREIYDQYGIEAIDRNSGEVASDMLVRTREGMEQHRKFREEQVEIDRASQMGYLGRLSPELQQRAFDQQSERAMQFYNNEVAEGRMTEQEANAAMARDMNEFYARAGAVPDHVTMMMTAAVLGPLVDDDGNPNPAAVDAITQYAEVRSLNPRAGDDMLDPEARVIADAVLSRTANPSMLGEAVRNIALEMDRSPLAEDTDTYLARPDVVSAMDRELENFINTRDIGPLHALWQRDANLDQVWDNSDNALSRLESEQTREFLMGEARAELAALQRINPHLRPRDLAARAWENVSRRVEVIGGDAVPLPPGSDFSQMFFGERAMEFMHDGAINSAVMEYLRSPEIQEQYPQISGNTGWDWLPGESDSTFFGFGPPNSSALNNLGTGVRDFRAFPTPQGQVAVQVLLPSGNYSEAIVIDAERAGQLYMERRRSGMTR